MSKKVFCGGLPWSMDDSDLEMALSQFGRVKEAKVITDRDTGKSRGFGFVTFDADEDADQAVATGSIQLEGRTVRIDHANERDRGGGGRGPRRGGRRG